MVAKINYNLFLHKFAFRPRDPQVQRFHDFLYYFFPFSNVNYPCPFLSDKPYESADSYFYLFHFVNTANASQGER